MSTVAHAAEDDAARRAQMLRMLNELDRVEALALVGQSLDCAAKADFACAHDRLGRAGRYAGNDAERTLVAKAEAVVEALASARQQAQQAQQHAQAARREARAARQEAEQARQAAATTRYQASRRAQALNWTLEFKTDWFQDGRSISIRCGDGRSAHIQETYQPDRSWHKFFARDRLWNSLEEAARAACS